MIQFDTTTIIICALIIGMALVAPMISIFFRTVRNEEEPSEEEDLSLPPLSILLTVHDNARELERHLPVILSQDYPVGYEVIAVVSRGEDDTDDVLKQFANSHSNLYVTFIPDTSRYMSRKKLAVTLGVKAAKNEWVLMTDATCVPSSDQWLKHMARHATTGTDLVIGYSNYDDEATDFQRFERLVSQRYILRKAQRGTAYRCEPGNLMFRKACFLDGRGFEGNLKYVRGEYDFIVNKFAERGNVATVIAPEAWMIEDAPTKKQYRNRHLYYMETRRHLERSFGYRLPAWMDQCALHLTVLFIVAAFAYGGFLLTVQPSEGKGWLYIGSAALALIITLTVRSILGQRGCRQFGEQIPAWKILPFEIAMVWKGLFNKIRYRLADKYNFICHKV